MVTCFHSNEFHGSWRLLGDGDVGSMSVTIAAVSDANKFVQTQSVAEYGYYPFGEFAHFVYCLLQKIKTSSAVPSVTGIHGSQNFKKYPRKRGTIPC